MSSVPLPLPRSAPSGAGGAYGSGAYQSGAYRSGAAGAVWLTGTDRLPFLQRLSTNRVDDLAPGEGRSTLILTDTGRVVDWVACHHAEDGTLLVTTHPASAPAVAAHLARYVLRESVRVTDATGQVRLTRLYGPGASAAAAALAGVDPDAAPGTFARRGDGALMIWALAHTAPWPDGGWDIVVPQDASIDPVLAACTAHGLTPATEADYTLHRIACRAPMFGAEIDGTANPLELGLIRVVDFAKGCYVGQEVVARLDTYRKVQRRLISITSERALSPGDVVRLADADPAAARRRDGQGRVTSAAADAGGSYKAMALVPSGWADSVRTAIVDAAGNPVTVTERADPDPLDAPTAAPHDERAEGNASGA